MPETKTNHPTADDATPNPQPHRGQLYAALARASTNFAELRKDREVEVKHKDREGRPKGSHRYAYATLGAILSSVKGPLADEGLVLVQHVDETERGTVLVTILGHTSGAELVNRWGLNTSGGPQDVGSRITYWRRYQALSILGLAPSEDEDDDGARAQDAHRRQREEQQRKRQQRKAQPKQQPKTDPGPTKPPSWDTAPGPYLNHMSAEHGDTIAGLQVDLFGAVRAPLELSKEDVSELAEALHNYLSQADAERKG